MAVGLSNAPAVFQRLMQRVLMGLNPVDGQAFVSVYIDDILIYSRSLEEHITHLRFVLERVKAAGLKLKLSKCAFVRQEVEYVLTPDGLKTNPKLVESVADFPTPRDLKEFLGLCSYYRRFINYTNSPGKILRSPECQTSFTTLKRHLTSTALDKAFVVETDASIKGLGAVLSQLQDDGPVAYASR